MSPTVQVRSIDALEELQTRLIRYADQAEQTLAASERETRRVLNWLDERVRRWRNEAQHWQDEECRASAALQRCLSSGDRDHPPSCGREEQALTEARRRLTQAEAEARMATQARQAVQAEADSYTREVSRMRVVLQTETPKAMEVLRRKVTVLRAYTTGSVIAGALAFGAGLAVGAAIGRASAPDAQTPGTPRQVEDSIAASGTPGVPDLSGREPPLQALPPDIHDVQLDIIDLSDSSVQNADDFHKISHDDMVAGLSKLARVRQWIAEGATEQRLYDVDQEARADGMPEAQSYHNIYKVFYGDSAIALERIGDRYRVINGYHRLAVAKELGWTTIPARIVG